MSETGNYRYLTSDDARHDSNRIQPGEPDYQSAAWEPFFIQGEQGCKRRIVDGRYITNSHDAREGIKAVQH